MLLLIFIIAIIGFGGIISNQYAMIKRTEEIEKTLKDIHETIKTNDIQ